MDTTVHSIKLKRFLIENLDALYRSTGKRLYEFQFSGENVITIILGKNGVGKSVLINEITPAPFEAVFGRSEWRFVEGENGRKELDFFVNDRYIYRVR